jgi:hypothetical protein
VTGKLLIAGALLLVSCGGAPTQQPTPAGQATPPGPSATPPATATPGLQTPTTTHGETPATGEDYYLGGTITWTASGTDNSDPVLIESSSGTANVVIHVINPYLILAEREGHSTYSYDYSSNTDICPASHEEGTLESQAGVGGDGATDYSIGTLNVGGPAGEDLSLTIDMPDYCGASTGANPPQAFADFQGFPDCEPGGDQLFARYDGVDSYVIDCDVIGYGPANEFVGTASGHVSGTLTPVEAPPN